MNDPRHAEPYDGVSERFWPGTGAGDAPLLTICVMAYGREAELVRCLGSIDCKEGDRAEVLVLEDASPTQAIAVRVVGELAPAIPVPVRLVMGHANVGFDRSIARGLRLGAGRYVLLISDDDAFEPGALGRLLSILAEVDCGFVITGFWSVPERELRRSRSGAVPRAVAERLDPGLLYDCVLFSGLVFERQTALALVDEDLAESLYTQVHLGMLTTFARGAHYLDLRLIRFLADGPNFFGRTSTTRHRPLLSDRQDWRARFAYHEGLFAACRAVDRAVPQSRILARFQREYVRRSFIPLARLGNTVAEDGYRFIAGLEALVGRRCPSARFVRFLSTHVSADGTLWVLRLAARIAQMTMRRTAG